MKMDQKAGSKNDEYYTPPWAVPPILKYVPKDSRIWCPFDTEQSHIVKGLIEHGCEVNATHISQGQDFFDLQPPTSTDFIISNPPYSKKTNVLEKLFDMDIPFAMLMGVAGIFEGEKRFSLCEKYGVQLIWLNRRIDFLVDFDDLNLRSNAPFSSAWICHGMLPHDNVFERVNIPKKQKINKSEYMLLPIIGD